MLLKSREVLTPIPIVAPSNWDLWYFCHFANYEQVVQNAWCSFNCILLPWYELGIKLGIWRLRQPPLYCVLWCIWRCPKLILNILWYMSTHNTIVIGAVLHIVTHKTYSHINILSVLVAVFKIKHLNCFDIWFHN